MIELDLSDPRWETDYDSSLAETDPRPIELELFYEKGFGWIPLSWKYTEKEAKTSEKNNFFSSPPPPEEENPFAGIMKSLENRKKISPLSEDQTPWTREALTEEIRKPPLQEIKILQEKIYQILKEK